MVRNCIRCNTAFEVDSSHLVKKYCSILCRNRDAYKRHRDIKNKLRREKPKTSLNREQNRIRRQRFKRRHPLRQAEQSRAARQRQRKMVLALLGDKCCQCGFNDVRALHLDHIVPFYKNKSPYRGGHEVCSAILRGDLDLQGFQLLCANCNCIKTVENGERPRPSFKYAQGANAQGTSGMNGGAGV